MAYNLHGSCSCPTSISPPMHAMLASSSSSLHNQRALVGPEVENGPIRPLPMKRLQLQRPPSSIFIPLHDHFHPSITTATATNNNSDDEDDNNNNKDVSHGNSTSKETTLIFTNTSPTLSILAASISSQSTAATNNENNNVVVADVCAFVTSTSEKSALVFTYNSPPSLPSSSSLVYMSSTTNNNPNNLEDVIDCTTGPSKDFTLDFTCNSPALSSLPSVSSSSSSSSSSRFGGEIFQEIELPLLINEKDGYVFDQASDPSSCDDPLDNMDSLRKFLPLKRGLSRHYIGKSQSLTSFDGIETVFDLAKSDYRSLKKSRIVVA